MTDSLNNNLNWAIQYSTILRRQFSISTKLRIYVSTNACSHPDWGRIAPGASPGFDRRKPLAKRLQELTQFI